MPPRRAPPTGGHCGPTTTRLMSASCSAQALDRRTAQLSNKQPSLSESVLVPTAAAQIWTGPGTSPPPVSSVGTGGDDAEMQGGGWAARPEGRLDLKPSPPARPGGGGRIRSFRIPFHPRIPDLSADQRQQGETPWRRRRQRLEAAGERREGGEGGWLRGQNVSPLAHPPPAGSLFTRRGRCEGQPLRLDLHVCSR